MTVLITDAKYRMVPALIESLGRAGYKIAVCQVKGQGTPLGFYSKYVCDKEELADDSCGSLLKLCQKLYKREKEKITLLPVGAATLFTVSKNRELFKPVCHLCIPDAATLTAVNDKEIVRRAAIEENIRVPKSYARKEGQTAEDFLAKIPLPCVVKPKCGEKYGLSAKERYRIAKSPDELQKAYSRFLSLGEEPILQEYISGFGVGVSLVMDNNHKPVSVICHQRIREYPITGGPSASCRSFYDEALVEQAVLLLKHFAFTGVAMVEFKGNFEDGFSLLEINPRIWGTFPLVRAAKSDFALCWCRAALGEEIPFRPNYNTGVLMKFTVSELAAALSQLQTGRWGDALYTFTEAVNPFIKDGVFTLSDIKPGMAYIGSMVNKALKRDHHAD
jgi:predicted ATP-grasp superfamily ATP-dependent carboligase